MSFMMIVKSEEREVSCPSLYTRTKTKWGRPRCVIRHPRRHTKYLNVIPMSRGALWCSDRGCERVYIEYCSVQRDGKGGRCSSQVDRLRRAKRCPHQCHTRRTAASRSTKISGLLILRPVPAARSVYFRVWRSDCTHVRLSAEGDLLGRWQFRRALPGLAVDGKFVSKKNIGALLSGTPLSSTHFISLNI